jgi:hypothetical protein
MLNVLMYPNFDVPFEEFRDAVAVAAAKYLVGLAEPNAQPSAAELARFIGELKIPDLYGTGVHARQRTHLVEFDRQHDRSNTGPDTVRGDADADEVIDAVYVGLFGTGRRGRSSIKIQDLHRRGSLRGWLRAIILHAAVDVHRSQGRSFDGRLVESGDEFLQHLGRRN